MLKPQQSATRELINLDGLWRFALDSAAVSEPWATTLDTNLEAAVPASYNDLFIDPQIRNHVGWVWYQRTFRVPRGWDGERIFIRLDAATHEGKIFVNDALVASHVGGYLPFEADITDHVAAGAHVRLTVGVNNELTNETIPRDRFRPAPMAHASSPTSTTSSTTRALRVRSGSTARQMFTSPTSQS